VVNRSVLAALSLLLVGLGVATAVVAHRGSKTEPTVAVTHVGGDRYRITARDWPAGSRLVKIFRREGSRYADTGTPGRLFDGDLDVVVKARLGSGYVIEFADGDDVRYVRFAVQREIGPVPTYGYNSQL
jgi:hypothetical protein